MTVSVDNWRLQCERFRKDPLKAGMRSNIQHFAECEKETRKTRSTLDKGKVYINEILSN